MRLAVVGKGGAGKSVISGTLARVLARRGHRVLALDSDPLPGLSFSLGADVPVEPPLNAAVERGEDRRWRFVKGVGAVRAVQRFATDAPDGVKLLQIGKTTPDGMAPVMASHQAFYLTIHRLEHAAAFSDWVILGDLPAGPRQTAFNWAPYAKQFVLVVEPTWQSMLTARRIMRIASKARDDVQYALVVNKSTGPEDAERVGAFLQLPVTQAVPVDEGVRSAELLGVALLDHAPQSPVVAAVERLAESLERSSID